MNNNNMTGLEIAVIGMDLKFPGASCIEEFWDNLKNGNESISFFEEKQLLKNSIPAEIINHPNYVRARGVIENLEYFDNKFFNYTPNDARIMDPQMRVLHGCAWSALENAGYNSETFKGPIGCFIGAQQSISWINHLIQYHGNNIDVFEAMTLNGSQFFSTRLSYNFNLRGPSYTVQTACSSSLVSIILGCQSLLSGDSDLAIAGGVSVNLPQETGYLYKTGSIKSKDGHCRAFDANASGTVSGNGVGIVVLKRLQEAIDDGDNIYAIVKGFAINNDGTMKAGYTAPSIDGQVGVIRMAHQMAEIEPESISYIETHGTGTIIGDPIEMEALKIAFNSDKKDFCNIGSVKTNIGHLDSAAGVAGFIKTVLVMKNKVIPPTVNFIRPNPKFDFTSSPFRVNNSLYKWERDEQPLRGGVSSFGIGGTNAHIVLEEPPENNNLKDNNRINIVLISGKTKRVLEKASQNLSVYLNSNSNVNFTDICYTLQVGRKHFDHRCAVICSNHSECIDQLSTNCSTKLYSNNLKKEIQSVVFMFSGQGTQYVGMGLGLYETNEIFRAELDKCFKIAKIFVKDDLKKIMFYEKENSKIYRTDIAQPIIFIFEYALAKLLIQLGIKPRAMIGHSLGEYTAACLSGVLSLEDAIKLIVTRGKLMNKMDKGFMLSVSSSRDKLEYLLNDQVSLAAINSPNQCTISGNISKLNCVENYLKANSIEYQKLHTPLAYHSYMVEIVVDEFRNAIRDIEFKIPTIPYMSNVTGTWMKTDEIVNAEYWVNHMRDTVMFMNGIKELEQMGNPIFVEVGPGKILNALVRQSVDSTFKGKIINCIRHPREKNSDLQIFLSSIAHLWTSGITINWNKIYNNHEKLCRVPLPTYPFEGNKFNINIVSMSQVSSKNITESEEHISEKNKEEEFRIEYSSAQTNNLPRNEIEQKVINAYSQTIGIHKIGIHDDFYELGGDSLKAVNVLGILSKDFDIKLNDIFEFPTASQLSTQIVYKKDILMKELNAILAHSNINSENETDNQIFENEYRKYIVKNDKYNYTNLNKKATYKNILITGSSGYIGTNLLNDISNMTDSNIYLIVRGEDNSVAKKRILEKLSYFNLDHLLVENRVTIINGDISKKRFALSDDMYNLLCDKIDCVINTAGNSNHYGKYSDFESANIHTLENIIEFAQIGIVKDINHISTIGVSNGNIDNKKYAIFTEYDYEIGQNTIGHYAKSKLEAERLILEARKKGIKINNFRLGNVVFNSNTGVFQQNKEQNAIYSLMKAYIKLGVIPITEMLVDFGFVDYITKAITLLFNRSELINETYHLYNPNSANLHELLSYTELDFKIRQVSLKEFLKWIFDNYENQGLAQSINILRTHFLGGTLPNQQDNTITRVYCDKTTNILKKLGFEWCAVDKKHIDLMIKHCLDVGFI